MVIVSTQKVQKGSSLLKLLYNSLPPLAHRDKVFDRNCGDSEWMSREMDHPDIPKQNGNLSELYDKFPAEYNAFSTVRETDSKNKLNSNKYFFSTFQRIKIKKSLFTMIFFL